MSIDSIIMYTSVHWLRGMKFAIQSMFALFSIEWEKLHVC